MIVVIYGIEQFVISINQGDACVVLISPIFDSAANLRYLASRIASIHVLQSVSVAAFSSYCRWFSLLYDIAKQCCNRETIKNSVISNVEGMTIEPTKSTIPPLFDLHIVYAEKCRREANRRRFKEEIAIENRSVHSSPRSHSVAQNVTLFIHIPYKSGNLLSNFI